MTDPTLPTPETTRTPGSADTPGNADTPGSGGRMEHSARAGHPGSAGDSGGTATPLLVVYGAGGHGTVVADAAQCAGTRVLGFLDDRDAATLAPAEQMLDQNDPRLAGAAFIPAIGDNDARRSVFARIEQLGGTVVNIVHPSAAVSPSATLGRGVYIGPQAVVNAHATVGDGCIVNTAAVVEHHCTLGAFVHMAPGAVLGGGVHIGAGTLLGLGCRVLPRVSIGARCVVGSGAVVTRPAEDAHTLLGVPAIAHRRG